MFDNSQRHTIRPVKGPWITGSKKYDIIQRVRETCKPEHVCKQGPVAVINEVGAVGADGGDGRGKE